MRGRARQVDTPAPHLKSCSSPRKVTRTLASREDTEGTVLGLDKVWKGHHSQRSCTGRDARFPSKGISASGLEPGVRLPLTRSSRGCSDDERGGISAPGSRGQPTHGAQGTGRPFICLRATESRRPGRRDPRHCVWEQGPQWGPWKKLPPNRGAVFPGPSGGRGGLVQIIPRAGRKPPALG